MYVLCTGLGDSARIIIGSIFCILYPDYHNQCYLYSVAIKIIYFIKHYFGSDAAAIYKSNS